MDQVNRKVFEHVEPTVISLFIFDDLFDLEVLNELDIDLNELIEHLLVDMIETVE